MSVCRGTCPSVILTAPTVCLSPRKAVALSVHPTDSPSVIPTRPSYEPSVHPAVTPSMTRQSTTPPVSPAQHPSDHLSPSDRLYSQTVLHCLTIHPPSTPVRQPVRQRPPSVQPTHQSVRPSSTVPPSVRHTNQSVRPSATVTPSVTCFYQCLRLCSCGTKPQRSEFRDDVIMGTPMSS